MIGEKTLRNWRRSALGSDTPLHGLPNTLVNVDEVYRRYEQCQERILRLTQELMDYRLMRKG